MDSEIKTKTPFPQFIDKNPRKHFHWAMFVVLALAIAAGVLVSIEKFKTEEEIDSMIPEFKKNKVNNYDPFKSEPTAEQFKNAVPNDFPIRCLGDANEDGKVDNTDVGIVKKSIGSWNGQENYNSQADLDHTGVVNDLDLDIVLKDVGCKK